MVFSLEQKSDESLMEHLARGREEAFSILFKRHFQRVFSFFFRSTGNEESAKDLAQEVFMKVYRASSSYEPKAKFTTWLFTISRNTLLNFFRELRKESHLARGKSEAESLYELSLKSTPSHDPDPSMIFEARELGALIRESLDTLPESLRTPFVLSRVNGLDYIEISEVLGLSPNAVKIRVFRAREAIMKHLKNRKSSKQGKGSRV